MAGEEKKDNNMENKANINIKKRKIKEEEECRVVRGVGQGWMPQNGNLRRLFNEICFLIHLVNKKEKN